MEVYLSRYYVHPLHELPHHSVRQHTFLQCIRSRARYVVLNRQIKQQRLKSFANKLEFNFSKFKKTPKIKSGIHFYSLKLIIVHHNCKEKPSERKGDVSINF